MRKIFYMQLTLELPMIDDEIRDHKTYTKKIKMRCMQKSFIHVLYIMCKPPKLHRCKSIKFL